MVSHSVVPTTPVAADFPGKPGGIIWVGAGPFFHNPHAALTWQPPGSGVIHPGSVFGFIPGQFPQDALIVTGHMMPNHDLQPDNESKFHADIILKITELQAVMGADTPVIFVGFSEGGIELSATARHWANAQNGGKWSDRTVLVMVSTPYSTNYLHQPQRALVRGSLHFHATLGIALSHHFGPMLAAGEIKLLRERWNPTDRANLSLLEDLINRSARDSDAALQNAQIIAGMRAGFGPALENDGHVVLVNLPDDNDAVVKVHDNLRATLRSYPGAHSIILPEVRDHGLLFADAASYRNALALPAPHNSIRGHFAHQWGLAT